MSTHDRNSVTALLDAGAVLPLGTIAGEEADTLTVRGYTHPVLDGRRVVRLVPGTLGEAEDLALDFLGLIREPETPEVGQVRRETLGFPAWALVNDPANGHHALALVKDIERLARIAKSRAGAARDGFEALAERLGRAVPHFLPTFHEQAARVFLQHENTTYAAAFFGKARAAERVHGLTVDEDRQRAVFLEFAFAGALTVKALKEHVKDLALRLDPSEAWRQFRQLAVERCAAGMPPYASLPQDARALIKAAGLNRVTEECALVADLLASPAVVRAPGSFWTAYRPTLVVLAERQPAVRARLLEIMPTGLGRDPEHDEFWLALLAETGADTLLTGEAGETAAAVDAADWLTRWATHRKHGSPSSERSASTLALVARMAPRLRADGRPVDLFAARWRVGAELDLLDLCAAEGVPLTVPEAPGNVHLPLAPWLLDRGTGRRDLVACGADPRLRRLLHHAIGQLGDQRTQTAALEALAAHPVLSTVLHAWLDEAAERFTGARGLPASRAALSRMRSFRSVAARVNPGAVARVAGHDLAPLLGRTLREGILDELGWPALEEAIELLDAAVAAAPGEHALGIAEAWPALVLSRKHKVVVVGPDKVLLEHDLRIPVELDRWHRPEFRYTDGELLVMWREGDKQRGYWSARPADIFTLGGEPLPTWWHAQVGAPSIPLPGGGRATGGRTLHAGDTVVPPSHPVLGDGTSFWRQGKQGREQVWMEYDPVTGTHGRASLPAFLRSGIREGARLQQDDCEVLPLQPGLETSPFGTDGTVLGRWVRVEGEGSEARCTAGTPDGRIVGFPLLKAASRSRAVPLGALRLPGGAEPVVAHTGQAVSLHVAGDTTGADELATFSVCGNGGEFAAGTRLVPPLPFWHALRPRDEKGSAVLRAFTDAQAADVLKTTASALAERSAEVARTKEYTGPSATAVARACVARALPGLAEKRLIEGVSALVQGVLRHVEGVNGFVAPPTGRTAQSRSRTEGMFADHSPEHGDDHTLRGAVAGIVDDGYSWWSRDTQWATLRQIRSVNHVLSGRPAEGKPLPGRDRIGALGGGWHSDECTVTGMGLTWPSVLGALRALAFRAASPAVPAKEREALCLLFEAIAAGRLAAPGGGLREVVLGEKHETQQRVGQVLRRGDRTVVILACKNVDGQREQVHWAALDHDPSGAFGAVAHFTAEGESDRTPDLPAARLDEVIRLLRDKGATPWREGGPGELVAATGGGLGPVQAALLLAGMPQDPDTSALAAVGLKPRQREFGEGLLASLGQDGQTALAGALLPEEPAELWTTGPDIAAAGRVWAERLGDFVRLPEEVAGELAGVPAGAAEAVLNPARTPWLSRTTVQRPDKDGDLVPQDPHALPGRQDIPRSVAALAQLAYGLPYGHRLRAALPGGLAALRRRLADPGLLVDADIEWTAKGGPTAVQLRKAYGLPATGGADAHGLTHVGEALVLRPWYGDTETVLVRPAGLTGPDDAVFGLVEGLVGPHRGGALHGLRAVLGDGLERALAAGTGPDSPAGHAQDPTFSVPDLVAEVAAAHGLGEDAAALYLQLLALPDPTDRNCARWTGWKPARIKKARTELAASGLVVEARRPRAGRTLFLPCGWRDLKAPALPVETWKERLYPVRDHVRTVPLLPVSELFTAAWDRVRDGDAPAFEELTTRATRKGRRR